MHRLAVVSFALTLAACGDSPPGGIGEDGSSSGSSATSSSSGGPAPTTAGPGETSSGTSMGPGAPTSGGPDATSGETSGGPVSTTSSETSGSTGEPGTSGTTGSSGETGDDTTTGAPLEQFLLGMDVQDVSPSPAHLADDVYMGAYGAPYMRGPATGVHDPIFARSFAIEGNGGGLVMAIVDLPGMGNQVSRAVRQKVAAMTGLDEMQVLVGSTHSHSAPDFMGLWGGINGAYNDYLIDVTVASMVAAWDSRQPGELRVATGKAPANNRRGWGFTDDDMTILDAFDLQQQRIGTVVVFAAHPVVLGIENTEISCDYPGYMVQALEAELGAPVALFNGTLGDATPKVPDGMYADDFARADAYGTLLAEIAADIAAAGEPVEPVLEWSSASWEQSVENELFQLASLLGILKYDFEMELLSQKVTTQSTYFRLGTTVQGAAFPGEPLTRLGLGIKEVMKTPHKIILGNTGDALGYFIPGDEWMTGKNDDYEESVSLGESAGDNAKAAILPLVEADNAKF